MNDKNMQVTDIVISTYNRIELLKKTLERIYKYTKTPYCLHVIDDGSTEGNTEFLIDEYRAGRVHHLLLRSERCGTQANANVGAWMSFSDPVVFTDDDVLCPGGIEPDWLQRGLNAMAKFPELGLLALDHPGARRRTYEQRDEVNLCKYVGGTFMFVRRKFLHQYSLPHFRGNYGHVLTQFRSQQARSHSWLVGYLRDTHCLHIGATSANGSKYGGQFIKPVNWLTLEVEL